MILQLSKYPIDSVQAYQYAIRLGLDHKLIQYITHPEYVCYPCLNHGTCIGIICLSPICISNKTTLNGYIDIRPRFKTIDNIKELVDKVKDLRYNNICNVNVHIINQDAVIKYSHYPCQGCTMHRLNDDIVCITIVDSNHNVLVGWDKLTSTWSFIYSIIDKDTDNVRTSAINLFKSSFPSLSNISLHRFGVVTTSDNHMVCGFYIKDDNIWQSIQTISLSSFPVLNVIQRKQLNKFGVFNPLQRPLLRYI